jgi:hypothetical protein
VYNMYSWDQPADEHSEQPKTTASGDSRAASGKTTSPTQAVQVALDRRDNGGDSGPRRGH